jgi:integrase
MVWPSFGAATSRFAPTKSLQICWDVAKFMVMKEAITKDSAGGKPGELHQERGIKEIEKGVFRVRVFTGRHPLTGSPIQRERIVRGGIRRAREVRSDLESEARDAEGSPDMTVAALLDVWLETCRKRLGKPGRAGLEQNTYDNYDLQVRTLKSTQLATTSIGDLRTRGPVEQMYEALGEVLGPARMVQVHKALRQAFNYAIGEGWMLINPAALVREKPSPPKRSAATPTSKEVEALIVAARAVHPDLDAFLATAALTGLRRQALCGLRWSDVDLQKKLIHIRRVLNVVRGKPAVVDYAKHRRGQSEPPPKHLDAALAPMLKELRDRQRRRLEETGTSEPKDGWLFSRDGMGLEHVHPDHFGRLVGEVMDCVDLKSTLHSLRHHRGSQLVARGVDPATAAAELDHKSTSYFVDTYVHPLHKVADAKLKAVGKSYKIKLNDEATP